MRTTHGAARLSRRTRAPCARYACVTARIRARKRGPRTAYNAPRMRVCAYIYAHCVRVQRARGRAWARVQRGRGRVRPCRTPACGARSGAAGSALYICVRCHSLVLWLGPWPLLYSCTDDAVLLLVVYFSMLLWMAS